MVFTYSGATLYHGDYKDTLNDQDNIKLIVTSPPYNIGSGGQRRDGKRKEGIFDPKSFTGITIYEDSFNDDQFYQSQIEFIRWAISKINKNGCIAYNHKNKSKLKSIQSPWFWLLPLHYNKEIVIQQEVVWDRGSTHNHDKNYFYPQTERIWFLRHPEGNYKLNNKIIRSDFKGGLGDIWKIPVNSYSATMTKHQASFPLELVNNCIDTLTNEEDLVCDPYSGSGTTFIASVEKNRRFIGSEKNFEIFTNACERIKKHFKL